MKKILVISHVYSHPTNVGNKKYILDYCKALQKKGAEVYFLYIGKQNKEEELQTSEAWGSKAFYIYLSGYDVFLGRCLKYFCKKILKRVMLDYLFVKYGINNQIRNIENEIVPDTVIVNYYWLSKALTLSNAKKRVIATHDCFTNKFERLGIQDLSMTPSLEQKYLRRSNMIMSIQENESQFFRILAPHIPCITVYPPLTFTKQDVVDNKNILYIASNNQLNKEGLVWFIDSIFPQIVSLSSQYTLIIGGKISDSVREYSNNPNIKILGMVDNLEDFYEQGNIVVNPTLKGTGLKIKTIEAISYGKLVITSKHSSEGLYDNKDIPTFIGESSSDFVEIFKLIEREGNKIFESQQLRCSQYIKDVNDYSNKAVDKLL